MNSNIAWFVGIALIAVFVIMHGCTARAAEDADATKDALPCHDKDANSHHEHYSVPHAHMHGTIIYNKNANIPPSGRPKPEVSDENKLTRTDISIGIFCIAFFVAAGFALGYLKGRKSQ